MALTLSLTLASTPAPTPNLSALWHGMRGTERCKFGQQRSLRVEASHGGRGPRGLEEGVDVLLCTAEKANVVVNRLIEEGRVSELGAGRTLTRTRTRTLALTLTLTLTLTLKVSELGLVVLDEVHMLAEDGRGYLLELLLTKLRVLSRRSRS